MPTKTKQLPMKVWLASKTDEERKAWYRTQYQKYKHKPYMKANQARHQFNTLAANHQKSVAKRYPELFAESTITIEQLKNWIELNRGKECSYCGKEATHTDHIIPLSKGGKHEFYNLQMICGLCNKGKADQLPSEFEQHIRDQFARL